MNLAHSMPGQGFTDPVNEAQLTFRAVLDALSHPGRTYPVHGPAEAPAKLGAGPAAVALTLFDADTSVWLHPELAADADVEAYLAFHTGMRLVDDSAAADFVLTTPQALPALESLRRGTDEQPHHSATVILDARGAGGGTHLSATGPGIRAEHVLAAPWAPPGFVAAWTRNGEIFPRGVDLVVVDDDSVLGLPRTTRLAARTTTEAGA